MKKMFPLLLTCLCCLAANNPNEPTPTTLPGAEPFIFKTIGDTKLLLHVVKPSGWSAADTRPCLVSFFGGGWVTGTPAHSIGYAKWAASLGMVGIAPDYRTRSRYKTSPEACVSDGRAAVRWIQDHAGDLGIDPTKIICLGDSAGGHVAAWTAIPGPVSPGTASDPAPKFVPAALILLWPVTDTTKDGYWRPSDFGQDAARAAALSITLRMPTKMPPTLVFHGTADKTVPYTSCTTFVAKMKSNGNQCDLITFPDAPHSPTSSTEGEKGKERAQQILNETQKFLVELGILKSSATPQ